MRRELRWQRYRGMRIYEAVLEAEAAGESARMVAMREATDAAEEMVADLTLTYNKARQELVTSELLDIVSGKAALESKTRDYTRGSNLPRGAREGAAIDNEIIPAIINAVNNHDELLAALKELVADCDGAPCGHGQGRGRDAVEKATDARSEED